MVKVKAMKNKSRRIGIYYFRLGIKHGLLRTLVRCLAANYFWLNRTNMMALILLISESTLGLWAKDVACNTVESLN